MKKNILYLICFVIIALLILGIYKLLNKKNSINISNSIVYIESIGEDDIISGTGFVYKKENNKNYILTNYHVIEDSRKIYVYNKNKEKIEASVFDYDMYNDIAILAINDDLGLETIEFAKDYNTKKVYVISSFKDKFNIITEGKIVSNVDYLNDLYDFIPVEISAKTYYGSSGSPVLNSDGKVIGMIFLRDKDDSTKSFFIPISFISDFVY